MIKMLKSTQFETPVGSMIAVSDAEFIHLLEFVQGRSVKRELEKLQQKTKLTITPGETPPLRSIAKELKLYFKNQLEHFKTPFFLHGTLFQKQVWKALMKIPFGKTWSYAELAAAIKHPTAYRAVANANGANQLAIVIPCHRVINANGALGGYDGGISRKKWLLEHESKLK